MSLSPKAEKYYAQSANTTKMGDLRKMAKEIKRDHELALELWSTGEFMPRQLAILIMDKKLITQEVVDQLDRDMMQHKEKESTYLMDWLMANQLMKHKSTVALIESWEHSPSTLQRRVFWYYQARLRWTGQTPPPNSEALLAGIEERMENEVPPVQWAMNFTAAQIGIHQQEHRTRIVDFGERLGLYSEEPEVRGCTPNYLPKFISIEVAKRKK
ncbi:MAG: DNA alkylation repair protein [Bacteroidota bacterium]